jgi:hypothetical protein
MKKDEWKVSVEIVLTDMQDREDFTIKSHIIACLNEFYSAFQNDKFVVYVSQFSLEKIDNKKEQ